MSDINPGLGVPSATAGSLFGIYPSGAIPFTAASGNVANANAIATAPAFGNRVPYLLGAVFAASGATTAVVVNATILGSGQGTLTFPYAAIAGVLLQGPTMIIQFGWPGIAANAVNINFVCTLPALGTGNTNAAVFCWGYNL